MFLVYRSYLSPVSRSEEEKEIIIEPGMTSREIGSLLDSESLIKSDKFFILYLKINNSTNVVGGNNGIKLIINTNNEKYEISTATLDYDKFPSILNDYDITYGNE
jgi:cell division protein YceG involved in septum cleavage